MRWLILAGLIPFMGGCAATPTPSKNNDVAQQNIRAEVKRDNAEAPQRDSVSKLDLGQKNAPDIPQAKTELSGEILYYLLSAEIAGQRGELGLSAALYVKAAQITLDPRVAQRATRIAVYARDDKRAITAANLWKELEPDNLEIYQVLAALFVRSGDLEQAIKHFEYVLGHDKHTERHSFLLVTSLLSKEKDKQVALTVMKKLISTRQDNPHALYAYSQLALLFGHFDDALTAIEKTIQLKSDWTDAYILQSGILTRQNKKVHALEVLRKIVGEQEDNTKLRLFYARKLVDAKQFDEAIKQFTRLVDDGEHHEARYALGLLSLQMNKPALAEEHFLQLLKDKKRLTESRYYLGQAYELKDELDEAIRWYKKITKNQYLFDAKIRIAMVLARQGKLDEARQQLQNMSADSLEKELRVYLAEGEILNDAKQYEDAFILYSDALQQLHDNSRLLYARALTAEKLDKIAIAVSDLEKIVAREPANAQALNALGYTLVDKTEQLEKGVELIKKAIRLSPDDAAILDSLGWAYYRLGQYDTALGYLNRALVKLDDAEIAAHLGEVLWVAGQQEKAKQVWDEALQQAPNDAQLLNVMRKFSE